MTMERRTVRGKPHSHRPGQAELEADKSIRRADGFAPDTWRGS